MQLSENARRILDLRYARKGEEGEPTETPEEVVERVALNVAAPNALYVTEKALRKMPSMSAPVEEGEVLRLAQEFPVRTARRQFDWMVSTGQMGPEPGKVFVAVNDEGFAKTMHLGWSLAEAQAEVYRSLLDERRFFPNSPTWTGAGTPLGQLSACFVLPIDDDLASGRASIFETLKVATAIQQTGGGNGFSFGRLRPSGSLVRRSMGQASGPLGFLRVYDASFGEIAQGGSRRGANMGVLPVWHPDIKGFIEIKTVEGRIRNFNLSVAITDEFMDAVEKDEDFDLYWGLQGETDDPVAYTVRRTVRARDLFEKITSSAWLYGEPGTLFIDRANADNPCPLRYTYEATNPCGEQWLPPYGSCNLGSIAVARFAHWADKYGDSRARFDWEAYRQTIIESTQFLDDVIDANQYVAAVPELEESAMNERRIGLGLMGVADAMAIMGIRYGSPEGLDFASQITEFARYWSMVTSVQRARERGPFGWIEGSIYDPALHREHGAGAPVWVRKPDTGDDRWFQLWGPPTPLVDHDHDFGRPELDWGVVTSGVAEVGIRNACQFTFAPTGTISNLGDLEGSGLESFFALAYDRYVKQEGEDIVLTYRSALFEEALRRYGFSDAEVERACADVVANGGSCQGVASVPAAIQHAFVVAADLSPAEHVWMQAVCQKHVDNSESKTVNLPHSASVEDVGDAYRLAYKLGCKGITVYRQGSREEEVLVAHRAPVEEDQAPYWPTVEPLPIPNFVRFPGTGAPYGLPSRTFEIQTPFGHLQTYITELPDYPGRPFDIRLQLGKAGNDKTADIEAIGRMASVALRGGIPVDVIADQLEGIGGATVFGFGDRKVKSAADGVGKLLRALYLADTVSVEQDVARSLQVDATAVCPLCHNATLIFENGCRHCDTRLGGCGEYTGCD